MGMWGKIGSLAGAAAGAGLMFVPGGQLAGGALLGASAGLAKHEFDDLPKAQAQMQLAADTARYRPWTGLTPQNVDMPSAVGDVMQGGMTGLSLAQGIKGMGADPIVPKSVGPGGTSELNLGVDKSVGFAAPSPFMQAGQMPGPSPMSAGWLNLSKPVYNIS